MNINDKHIYINKFTFIKMHENKQRGKNIHKGFKRLNTTY